VLHDSFSKLLAWLTMDMYKKLERRLCLIASLLLYCWRVIFLQSFCTFRSTVDWSFHWSTLCSRGGTF